MSDNKEGIMRNVNGSEKNPFAGYSNKSTEGKDKMFFAKVSPLPKPDFSSIEKKESAFTYKQKGSYKKPKSNVPESPMKSPNQKFFTPVKLQTNNLFGSNTSTCRKLNFGEGGDIKMKDVESNFTDTFKIKGGSLLERLEEEKIIPSNEISPNIIYKKHSNEEKLSTDFLFEQLGMHMDVNMEERESNPSKFDFKSDYDEDSNMGDKYLKKESKFEREFDVLKTLDAGAFGIVYKCVNKYDNQIYAVKKSKKHSSNYDYNLTYNLINDFRENSLYGNMMSKFFVLHTDCWLEEEGHNNSLTENHLYVTQEYCKYGDLLDYLEKLEKMGFKFNEAFYWDLIFEMLCSVYFFHLYGYVHFDIKPGNFLIDETGCVKLGDFGLSRKFSEIKKGEDVMEGDSSYLAPEFFDNKDNFPMSQKKIVTNKCDIFSLGLSILEILCKIELPQNGVLWKEIRSLNFEIPEDFISMGNIQINQKMVNLIKELLTVSPDSRPEVKAILENPQYEELNYRYKNLMNNSYNRFLNPKFFFITEKEEQSPFAKRSNSYNHFD